MKKTLLILAISALTLSLNAYVPMLQNGKTWTHLLHITTYGPDDVMTLPSYLSGEKVIDGKTYMCYKHDGSTDYLRENVDSQRVYIYDPTDSTEKVLYDFSLNVGDSIEIRYKTGGRTAHPDFDESRFARIYIFKIDTVVDELGQQLRQFYFTSPYMGPTLTENKGYSKYIESYGSVSTFIHRYVSIKGCIGCSSGQLRCVTDSTGSLMLMRHSDFLDTNLGDACEGSGHYLAVENTPSSQVSIAYSNNTLSINAENINNVEIFTAAGVMVGCYQSSEINISLSPGIYLARIAADGRVSTERFIVK